MRKIMYFSRRRLGSKGVEDLMLEVEGTKQIEDRDFVVLNSST
jgi:hypothetical protein